MNPAANYHQDFARTVPFPCGATRFILPCLLFLLALFLRTSGLSHDLHLGYVYHPDTPKQIRATQQFLDDRFSRQYYQHRNHPDYDGYPFFNSHLVEHVYRVYFAVKNFTACHLGIPDPANEASVISIYWVTRLLNSLFSALAVVLVYIMGRRHFGEPAGLFAALLLATSPVDITTSNYAMSDSTAAFFALLAVFFALRVAESPRIPYYILGALAAAFAFSAKYHGGMALLPLGLAHLFAFPQPRSWIGPGFWARSLLLPLFFTAGVFLSTPALVAYPSGAYKDILGFMEYTSSFGMSAEMLALPLFARFTAAMRLNLPLLADYIGWAPLVAGLCGVFWFWRNTRYLVVISVPIFFVLVGLTLKPLSHPDYFTLITSLAFLAAAAVFAALWNSRFARIPSRILVSGLLLLSLAHLGNSAWHEIFFFRHNDTRKVAETWALDTIPRELRLFSGPYTFDPRPWNATAGHGVRGVHVLSDRTSGDPPNVSVMHRLSFEQEGKLTRNRNWNIRFLLEPNDVLGKDFSLPVMPRMIPSRPDDMIPADAPSLLRSPKVLELRHQERFKASIASQNPLETCAVILRNSAYPAEVAVRLGGKKQVVTLGPFERTALFWDPPRPIFLPRNSNFFYSLEVRSRFNLEPVTMVLATTKLEIARELHLAGYHDLAFDSFTHISPADMNASEKLAMAVSGLATGRLLAPAVAGIFGEDLTDKLAVFFADYAGFPDVTGSRPVFDDQWFFQEFGVHPRVFEWLGPDTDLTPPREVVIRQILILRELLAHEPDAANLCPADWEVLLLRGDAHARAERHTDALAFYLAALDLRQDKRAVYEALGRALPRVPEKENGLRELLQPMPSVKDGVALPLDIRFVNRLGITGFQANALRFRTGEQLEVVLHWDVPELRNDLYTLHYRVKLAKSGSGQTVFDRNFHFVRSVLADRDPRDLLARPHFVIPLSESISPGTYVLSLALVLPAQERTLRLRSPSDARNDKHAVITEIEVMHDNL